MISINQSPICPVDYILFFLAGGTETVAIKQADGSYKLYGYKWFSSATDADVALTLARVLDVNGAVVEVHFLYVAKLCIINRVYLLIFIFQTKMNLHYVIPTKMFYQ